MSFATVFSLQTALGVAVGFGWFFVPGLLVQRLLASRQDGRASWLFAPLLGMATFGPVSVLVFNLVPFEWPWLIATYLVFNASLMRWRQERVVRPSREVLLVLVACGVVAVVPCLSSYPFVRDGALYTGIAIHDHARVAFIDAIHRDGLPPLNPIFAPGQDVVFNYYYAWVFAAAQLRTLTGIPGWPAAVALTWLTFLAVSSACAGIALELGRTRAAAGSVVVLVVCGPLLDALPWLRALEYAPRNTLSAVVSQGAWSPHHLLAAGAIVLALYFFACAVEGGERGWRDAFVLGCLLGTVFGCSLWLALALTVSAPFLLLAFAWCYRQRPHRLGAPSMLLVRSALVAIVLCVPVLICVVTGPFAFHGSAVSFDIHPVASRTMPAWVQFGLFWVWAVPLGYGVSYGLGIAGVLRGLKRDRARSFAALSLAGIFGFLLVSQIIRSVVMNNDLGWRAHIVANLLLIVWSALLLDELLVRPRAWWWLTPIAALVACGLYAAPLSLPGPSDGEPAKVRAERRRFLTQQRAWEIVRRHAGPHDFVQSNPYAFSQVCPWPGNMGFMLFADRRSVFAHPNWIYAYTHNFGDDLMRAFDRTVRNAFSRHPDRRLLQILRADLHVEVLLVDEDDPVWMSAELDQSNVFVRAHSDPEFRVYVAKR